MRFLKAGVAWLMIGTVLFMVSVWCAREAAAFLSGPTDFDVAFGVGMLLLMGCVWLVAIFLWLRGAVKVLRREVQRGRSVRGKDSGRRGHGGVGHPDAGHVRDHTDRPGVRGNPGEHGGVDAGR